MIVRSILKAKASNEVAKTVADQLANQIKTTDATVSGVLLSMMHVSRTTEGAVVTHN